MSTGVHIVVITQKFYVKILIVISVFKGHLQVMKRQNIGQSKMIKNLDMFLRIPAKSIGLIVCNVIIFLIHLVVMLIMDTGVLIVVIKNCVIMMIVNIVLIIHLLVMKR